MRGRVRGWVGGWVGGCVLRVSLVCMGVPVCGCMRGWVCVRRACVPACVLVRACALVRAGGRAVKGTWRDDGKWLQSRWKMRKMDGKLCEDVWNVCLCASEEM